MAIRNKSDSDMKASFCYFTPSLPPVYYSTQPTSPPPPKSDKIILNMKLSFSQHSFEFSLVAATLSLSLSLSVICTLAHSRAFSHSFRFLPFKPKTLIYKYFMNSGLFFSFIPFAAEAYTSTKWKRWNKGSGSRENAEKNSNSHEILVKGARMYFHDMNGSFFSHSFSSSPVSSCYACWRIFHCDVQKKMWCEIYLFHF